MCGLRTRYSTVLSDPEWEIPRLLVPAVRPGGRRPKHARRGILNRWRTGCGPVALGDFCGMTCRRGRPSTSPWPCSSYAVSQGQLPDRLFRRPLTEHPAPSLNPFRLAFRRDSGSGAGADPSRIMAAMTCSALTKGSLRMLTSQRHGVTHEPRSHDTQSASGSPSGASVSASSGTRWTTGAGSPGASSPRVRLRVAGRLLRLAGGHFGAGVGAGL